MDSVSRFFWFCSGVHADTLKNFPTEHNKYVGIGATIFFTALFATLSGGYAMYFVFSGDDFAVFFAILFGLIWGLAIFNMDRYIVSSISKNASVNKQILQATPRILLAIMIGIVISRPLELKIFNKEIREKLKLSYLNGQRSKIDTLNSTFQNKYGTELGKLEDLTAERDSLQADITRSRYLLNQEIFGDKTNQTSGKVGYGTYAKQKEEVLNQKVARLDAVRGEISAMEGFVRERRDQDGLTSQRLFSNKQLDSLANVAGFADRNWALGQLSFKADGSRDLGTYLAEDTYLRLDRDLSAFLSYLDNKVGKGAYTVFISADHGAAHNPNFLTSHNIPSGLFPTSTVTKELNAYLAQEFKQDKLVLSLMNYQVSLNNSLIEKNNLDEEAIKKACIKQLQKRADIAYVVDMEAAGQASIPQGLKEKIINGYNRERSGAVQIILKPGYYSGSSTGTTHGTWNPYDTHIPFVLMGWGVKHGSTSRPTGMTDIAPTISALLRIQAPNGNVGKPVTEALLNEVH